MTKATEKAIKEKINAADSSTLEKQLLKMFIAFEEAKKGE